MNKIRFVVTFMVTVGLLSARADSWSDELRGALVGGALGALIGSNSSDIDSEVAIPVGAVLGGLLAYGNDKSWYSDSYGYDGWYYDDRYGHPRHRYYHPRHPYRYSRRGVDLRRRVGVAKARRPSRRTAQAADRVVAINAQPGVSIVKIPVTLVNGVKVDVRLIRLGDRFVGPQGEAYEALPEPDVLAARYGGHR